jgi:hypothetical protein
VDSAFFEPQTFARTSRANISAARPDQLLHTGGRLSHAYGAQATEANRLDLGSRKPPAEGLNVLLRADVHEGTAG